LLERIIRIIRSLLLVLSLGLSSNLGLHAADFEGPIAMSIKDGRQAAQQIT
jgi:hypothetical protein